MRRHLIVKSVLVAYVAWGGWDWLQSRPVHALAGVLAPGEPVQVAVTPGPALLHGRWTLTPRATYRITARILGVEKYRFDFLAPLIPEDLALGWGPMSDSRVLALFDISQSNRFFYWRSSQTLPVPREAIIAHSANTHVIPESELIARELSKLRPGQVVTMAGLLVDGRRDDGARIDTSLVRTDSGAGACEVLLVQSLSVDR